MPDWKLFHRRGRHGRSPSEQLIVPATPTAPLQSNYEATFGQGNTGNQFGQINATHVNIGQVRSQEEELETRRLEEKAKQDALDRRNILELLWSDYREYKDINQLRVPGTCQWFLESKVFRKWVDQDSSSVFWLYAGPGCGKSVLSRTLIDEELVTSPGALSSQSCYFFFKDGQQAQTTGAGALMAILHQIFSSRDGSKLMRHAFDSYRKCGSNLKDSFDELWDILVNVSKDPDAGQITCVLDALDEMDSKASDRLMKKLVDFYKFNKSSSTNNLKFLVTSRPYSNIHYAFENLRGAKTYFNLDGDDYAWQIAKDIDLVIDADGGNVLQGFSPADRTRIQKRLKQAEHRTYLWLYLTFDYIKDNRPTFSRPSRIEDLLDAIPTTVAEAYEAILSRVNNRDDALAALGLVVAAKRTLSLDEMNLALSLRLSKNDRLRDEPELWEASEFKNTLVNICGLFIQVCSSKVHLIHQTAREFLLGKTDQNSQKGPFQSTWRGVLPIAEANYGICLASLRLLGLPRSGSERIGDYTRYARDHWVEHFEASSGTSRDDLLSILDILFEPKNRAAWTDVGAGHMRVQARRDPNDAAKAGTVQDVVGHLEHYSTEFTVNASVSALYLAAAIGLTDLVKHMLTKGASVNASGSRWVPLVGAAEFGHLDTISALIHHGANINMVGDTNFILRKVIYARGRLIPSKDSLSGTAIEVAAAKNHTEVVRLLIASGSKTVLSPRKYAAPIEQSALLQSALSLAFEANASDVRELLCEHILERPNDENDKFALLLIAAGSGNVKIVDQILQQEAGPDVNTKDVNGKTALHYACEAKSTKVLGALLSANADINARDSNGDTPLHYACRFRSDTVVDMLLAHNAEVDLVNNEGDTALDVAASKTANSDGSLHTWGIIISLLAKGASETAGKGSSLTLEAVKDARTLKEPVLIRASRKLASSSPKTQVPDEATLSYPTGGDTSLQNPYMIYADSENDSGGAAAKARDTEEMHTLLRLIASYHLGTPAIRKRFRTILQTKSPDMETMLDFHKHIELAGAFGERRDLLRVFWRKSPLCYRSHSSESSLDELRYKIKYDLFSMDAKGGDLFVEKFNAYNPHNFQTVEEIFDAIENAEFFAKAPHEILETFKSIRSARSSTGETAKKHKRVSLKIPSKAHLRK